MYEVAYERPRTLNDAVRLIRQTGGRPLAGGQSLVAAMKLRLADHGTLVDLGAVDELRGIRLEDGHLVIGAMMRHAEVAESSVVQRAIPALARLAEGIGDRQVRNMGTVGGSLANSDPAACYPAAVLAIGASIQTTERVIPADAFFLGMYETALQEGELITALRFPVPLAAAYIKFEQPASQFALVGVCVARTSGVVRVAVTGGRYCAYRCMELEQALQHTFTPQAARGIHLPADDLFSDLHATAEYRAHLIPVICARAVAAALAG